MIDDELSELLTPGEVAETLRVSLSTLRDWAREGRLTAIVLPSGHRRYLRSEIVNILHQHETN